eukprot:gene17473-17666_t
MRDDLTSLVFPVHGEPIDPVAMARKDMQKNLPKRFYKEVRTELQDGAHALLLDGRSAKTPARNKLAVDDAHVAQVLVAEWDAQKDIINPFYMPMTRLLHSALDGVAREHAAVRAEILRYAGSDLTCYRALNPHELVDEQARAWDPVLDYVAREFGAEFKTVSGVMFQPQPEAALTAIAQALEQYRRPMDLAALHVLTSISGSTLVALAVARGFLDAERGFAAAHVDEQYQARVWGTDDEAVARLAQRRIDFGTAAFALTGAKIA